MNNNYLSPTMNTYSTPYDYSYEYSSPSTSSYFNSPLLQPPCPVHSPYHFYTSLSMNLSPCSHNYYPQQSQVYSTPPVQQRMYSIFFSFKCCQIKIKPDGFRWKILGFNGRNIFFFLLIEPIILSGADCTPLRRHKCFKKNELQILHQAYVRDTHPSTDALQQLAYQLKAPIEKVRVSYLLILTKLSIFLFLAMVQKSTP